MKTQRSLVVSIGALVLGGLLVTGSGIGITPAGADDDKGERQKNPLMQILNKLDKILDAIKGGEGQDGGREQGDQVGHFVLHGLLGRGLHEAGRAAR